ncbi:MAG: hypothetical protein AAGE65_05760 [Planctomycetota bacterium]
MPTEPPLRLLLHIGVQKTGSTAIQAALHERRRALLRAGVVDVSQHPWARRVHHKLGRLEEPDPKLVASIRASLEAQRDDARRHGRRLLVWSFEGFAGNSWRGYLNAPQVAAALRQITADVPTTVAVYLRRQDVFLESLYAQQVFAGQTDAFDAFVGRFDARHFDWAWLLDVYAKAFGADALRPRRYDAKTLLDDFEAAVGVPLRRPGAAAVRNPSCSAEGIAALRQENDGLDREAQKRFRAAVKRLAPKPAGKPLVFFAPAQRRDVIERYASSNASVAQRFFGTTEGVALFEATPELSGAEPEIPDAASVRRLVASARRESALPAWRTKLRACWPWTQRLSRWDV